MTKERDLMPCRRTAIIAVLAMVSFGIPSLTISSQTMLKASESNDLMAQNTDTISQDSVIPIEGCGSGCHYEIKAISNPEYTKDGWVRVKVEKTFRDYDIDGNPADFRGTKYGSKEIGWNFANCKEETFGYGLNPDRSDAWIRDAYLINGDKKGPNVSTAQGNTFQQFARLCPKHRGFLEEWIKRIQEDQSQ